MSNRYALSRLAAFAAFACLFAMSGVACAAVDMFLKILEIPGESTDSAHAKEIEVTGFSWGGTGESLIGSIGALQPGALGRCLNRVQITKYVDVATVKILEDMVIGSSYTEAKLTFRRSGTQPFEFLTLTFGGVAITSETTHGSTTDARLSETIVLGFSSVIATYTPQLANGQSGPAVPVKINAKLCPES